MNPQTLLIAKMMIFIVLTGEFFKSIHEPYLPYWLPLDGLRQWSPYPFFLQTTFYLSVFALLFNILPRLAAITVGSVIILSVVQSQIEFTNHKFLGGCILFLAGLERPGSPPYLLRIQFVLVYLGAYLNKQLDPHWLNGQFFENWAYVRIQHPQYIWLASFFPVGWLSSILSWVSIFSEFCIAVCFCFRRLFSIGIWTGLIFHTGTFIFMKGWTFGYFVEAILIGYMAFATWPKEVVNLSLPSNSFQKKRLRQLLSLLTWGGNVRISDESAESFELNKNDEIISKDRPALLQALLWSPGFYWSIFIAFLILHRIPPYPYSFLLTLLYGTTVLFFFFPFGKILKFIKFRN